jgi:hypothetical protein
VKQTWINRASFVCTALVLGPFVIQVTRAHILAEAQISCIARNVYYESRGEPDSAQKVVAYITLARAFDKKWGKTPCEVTYAPKQFSWTNGIPAEPKGREWEAAQRVAHDVYRDPVSAVPAKLRGARYYKRADDKGVSERSKKYFAKLEPMDNFGSHQAFREK